MTDKIDEIIIPVLRAMRVDMAAVKDDTTKIDLQLRAIGSRLGNVMSSVRNLEDEAHALRGRLEAIEERLAKRDRT